MSWVRTFLGLGALGATALTLVATSRVETCTANAGRTARVSGTCGVAGVVGAPTDATCIVAFDAGGMEGLPPRGELTTGETSLQMTGCLLALDGGRLPLVDGGARPPVAGGPSASCANPESMVRYCSGAPDGGLFTLNCFDDGVASCELRVEFLP